MLKFYGNPLSSNSQKVLYLLAETGIPHETQLIDLRKGEQARPEFLAVNPYGAVPAIEYNGLRLSESNTILRYLARRFGKTSWYPENLETAAKIDQAMDFATAHISRWLGVLNWNLVIVKMTGQQPNQAAINEAYDMLARYLPRFERSLQATTSYLVGSEPTIADAAFVPHAEQVKRFGLPLRDYPRVADYVDRVTARPAWKQVTAEVAKLLGGPK